MPCRDEIRVHLRKEKCLSIRISKCLRIAVQG
ncbi:hypothetical protein T11_12513 [Trichinella zimbabwensis]|uniref:Uncharacterized protein n=1 Tax=Trichinella zimbabwensis TaxID=268475 RepID=A0A0V1DR83_9BILA|nr:hypothetical protein T11_12513 [Trichinella zimbabwensis]